MMAEYENIINELSATVTQRDTSLIELTQEMNNLTIKLQQLESEKDSEV